jgi:hypothetical protein
VDTLAWEMAQWEVHALRNELQSVMMRVAIHARYYPDARKLVDDIDHSKDLFDAEAIKALRDPAMRKVIRV